MKKPYWKLCSIMRKTSILSSIFVRKKGSSFGEKVHSFGIYWLLWESEESAQKRSTQPLLSWVLRNNTECYKLLLTNIHESQKKSRNETRNGINFNYARTQTMPNVRSRGKHWWWNGRRHRWNGFKHKSALRMLITWFAKFIYRTLIFIRHAIRGEKSDF